jgi:SHS2 domain-containing protein
MKQTQPRFEFFDHTADTLFRAYGKTFEDALGSAILAFYNVIVDTEVVKPARKRFFVVEASSKETLVYETLNELVFLLDTEAFLTHRVVAVVLSQQASSWRAAVTLEGDVASGYEVHGQVKNATYHEMLITEEDGKVTIQAVLDL